MPHRRKAPIPALACGKRAVVRALSNWTASMMSKTVDLASYRLRFWTGGSGPALLLLHSAWGDAEMSWAPVWNDLSRSFTIVAPDLPGFGSSEPTETVSLPASALVLRGLLDHLGIGRATVIGSSFSVAVALEFAAGYPERTDRLVGVNGVRLPYLPVSLRKIMALPAVAQHARRAMRNATYSDGAFSKAFPDHDRLPAGFLEKIRHFEEQHSLIVFRSFLNQTAPQRQPAVPVTLIWGTGDRLVSRRQAANFRKWLGGHQFIPLEGAGHMPQVEMPTAFIEAVVREGGESPAA